MIDLSPAHFAIVERILAEYVPDCEVRAFGSRASWSAKDYSDLDLAIVGQEPIPRRSISRLKEAFEESPLPIRVDVVDWLSITDEFRKAIESASVIVQEPVKSESSIAAAPVRDLIEFAIGGGWGKESEFEGSVPVRVIRGTDFSRIRNLEFDRVPARFEKSALAKRRMLRPGDVVLEISGGSPANNQSTDRSLFITDEVLANLEGAAMPASFCRLIRFKVDVINPLYAYFALQEMYASGRVTMYEIQSTGISNFQFSFFLDSEFIPLPSLAEQRSIANTLGILDKKIELNRRMNETLEAMARALFKSWFVDFDPVRAKMAGRWRRGESLPGLPAEHYDHFPDRLVDSELGEIPEGWGVTEIGKVAGVAGGTTPSTKVREYWEGGSHCWATPKSLSTLSSPVLLETERKITDEGLRQIGSRLLPPGTLLLSSRAPIGYLAISEVPIAINQGFIAIPPQPAISNLFLLQWCSTFHEVIRNFANGSTFLEISKRDFRRIPIAQPPTPVMDAFDRIARPLHKHMVSNERESRTLGNLRDTLLPKLISGEIRVPDAEREVECVV